MLKRLPKNVRGAAYRASRPYYSVKRKVLGKPISLSRMEKILDGLNGTRVHFRARMGTLDKVPPQWVSSREARSLLRENIYPTASYPHVQPDPIYPIEIRHKKEGDKEYIHVKLRHVEEFFGIRLSSSPFREAWMHYNASASGMN